MAMIVAIAATRAAMPAEAQAPVATDAAEIFVDATEAAGIDAPHRGTWDEFTGKVLAHGYLGTGQAWADYDNDGWVDLFLAGGQSPSTLYRNNGDGTFSISEHAAEVALADTWTGGAVWADYDNDGWRDLYVLAHGPNTLFRNEAGAGFRDVTAAAGVGDAGKGSTATWGDYDADGFLDLFVANWAVLPGVRAGQRSRVGERPAVPQPRRRNIRGRLGPARRQVAGGCLLGELCRLRQRRRPGHLRGQ